MRNVAIIGTSETGLHGNGKVTPNFYYPIFGKTLKGLDINLRLFPGIAGFETHFAVNEVGSLVAILLYNELSCQQPLGLAKIQEIEARIQATAGGALILHSSRAGAVIGNKRLTAERLAAGGVPVPGLCSETGRTERVFSNAVVGSGAPVQILEPGEELDAERFNVEFIDTVHEFRGVPYYISLRAMCVGEICLSIYLRARPTSEGSASVHAANTPLDPDLLNYLYVTIVEPRRLEILQICRQIGEIFGLGFYSHDILPDRSGGLYVCETGFKFDDPGFRQWFWNIRDRLVFDDFSSGAEAIKSAYALVISARELGFLI